MQAIPTRWDEHRWLHTVQIPALRLAGFVALIGFVVLDSVVGPDRPATRDLDWFIAGTLAYCGVSWLLLRWLFGRTGRLNLGVTFLTCDIAVWVTAIYFTGGEQSWFLPLLVLRAADQMGGGFRKVLWYAHVSSLGYLVLVFHLVWVEGRQLSLPLELLKVGGIYVTNWYLCLCSRAVERLRVQIRQARATIVELNQVRAELAVEKTRAEEANRAKTEFLAAVNHEIRTSLNGIVGMTELLLGAGLVREEREYAEAIRHSSRELSNLVNGLLDLAKIEARRIDVKECDFELRSLVADVVEVCGALAIRKGLDLVSEVSQATAPVISADNGHLRRVLLNLVTNAIKFTAAGRIGVCAAVVQKENGGLELQFEVSDTGVGIPEEAHSRIFEPFFRAPGSSAVASGTGLGLAISRRLVDAMGGQIGFRSRRGEGTTFWFTVPAAVGLHAATAEPGGRGVVRVSTERPILVAEDDPVSRRMTTRILEKWGYQVHSVVDGHEAVEAASGTQYALIFMDCRMPRVDGLEAARRIRRAEGNGPRTPIVALTADVTNDDRERCLAAGMDGHIAKPVDSTTILDAIDHHLRVRGTSAST